jgi:hypothetical protein
MHHPPTANAYLWMACRHETATREQSDKANFIRTMGGYYELLDVHRRPSGPNRRDDPRLRSFRRGAGDGSGERNSGPPHPLLLHCFIFLPRPLKLIATQSIGTGPDHPNNAPWALSLGFRWRISNSGNANVALKIHHRLCLCGLPKRCGLIWWQLFHTGKSTPCGGNRKTASRRSLRNPIRCFDQAAA